MTEELVVGFRDEIYAENCDLRRRSEENRKRCIQLEQKIARLEKKAQTAKAEAKKTKSQCDEELGDKELQMAGALDTILALKEELRDEHQRYMEVVKQYEDRTAEAVWLRQSLDYVKGMLKKTAEICQKSEEDNARLREVNFELVKEIRRLN